MAWSLSDYVNVLPHRVRSPSSDLNFSTTKNDLDVVIPEALLGLGFPLVNRDFFPSFAVSFYDGERQAQNEPTCMQLLSILR